MSHALELEGSLKFIYYILYILTYEFFDIHSSRDCFDANKLKRNTCPKSGKSKMPKSETNPNAVLKEVNDNFIKLDGDDIKTSNKIIKIFVEEILMSAMRQEDPLFQIMYSVSE